MSTKKIIVFLIIAVAALILALKYLPHSPVVRTPGGKGAESGEETRSQAEKYIRENISDLSPDKEVLGGKFYVTKIEFADDNNGRVEYEDGHIALAAKFSYSLDQKGQVVINKFELDTPEKIYVSDDLNLRFEYPPHYFLERKNMTGQARTRTSLILTEDNEENRSRREGQAPAGEGPVSINIDVYPNPTGQSAESWVKNVDESNYKLSANGLLTATSVEHKDAISYKWSGLYEADNVVVSTDKFIYSFSVTYTSPEDQIRSDFQSLLKSVSFL